MAITRFITTSNGVTYGILIDAGLEATNSTHAQFETASQINSDNDVHWDWQEYIAGTNPSNAITFFQKHCTK